MSVAIQDRPAEAEVAGRAGPARLASLDQFRGFAVLGMFVVNFLSPLQVTPDLLKHHPTYVSYADAVMPQFFLAAGFAARLTLLRRLKADGPRAAYLRTVRRCLGLLLLGLIIHHLDGSYATWAEIRNQGVFGLLTTAFQRNFFQTLTHIGLTTLWVLPVLAAGPRTRIGFAVLSAALHVLLSSLGYYDWVMQRPGIDGGPLGFLTWTVPFLAGSLAYDLTLAHPSAAGAVRLVAAGVVLMALGYGLSCVNLLASPGLAAWLAEPPLVPTSAPADLWTMSQRAGSLTYQTFAAGFALAVYAVFVLACDLGRLRVGTLQALGQNALAAYLVHILVDRALRPYVPKDAPAWYALAAFALFFWICMVCVRYLERHRLYLRL